MQLSTNKTMAKCKQVNCCNNIFCKGLCEKHYSQERAKLYPYKHAYSRLKSNARCRSIAFELSFDEFKQFAIDHNYINKKGRSKNSFHIDRIDNSKGYSIGNIQILTNQQNARKGAIEKIYKKRGLVCDFTQVKRQLTLFPISNILSTVKV